MLINKDKFKCGICEALILAVSVIFVIGIRTWFDVCPVTSEMVMRCHWAGEVLRAISVMFVVVAVIHILVADGKMKAGMDITLAAVSLMTAFVPGVIISLCMGSEMNSQPACQTFTRPWTMALAIALTVLALADLMYYTSRLLREKHQRKDAA